MNSQLDLDRERYEASLHLERDHAALLDWARNAYAIGFKKGFEMGIKMGRLALMKDFKQGLAIGAIQLSQRLLKLPETPMEKLLKISLAELDATSKALETQLAAKP